MVEQKLHNIEYVAKRRSICDKCEHMGIFFKMKVCKKCGCAILGKTMLKGQRCPEGKWDAEKN